MTRDILSQFTEIGFRFNPHEIMKKNKEVISHTCSTNSFYRYHSIALQIGVSQGILLKNTDDIITDNPLGNLKSIHYWKKSMRLSKYKHIESMTTTYGSTYGTYLRLLVKFNEWLITRKFKIKKSVSVSEDVFRIVSQDVTFSSMEDLLELYENMPTSQRDIIKIIREYLTDVIHDDCSPSYMNTKFSAIMSYFEKNELPLGMKFNSKKYDTQEIITDSELTLTEFYDMLTVGKPSVMEKSIMLIKFQAGFDSSTLADRFNFDGLKQIIDYFGTEKHNLWNLEKCPVPLQHVRMKNGFQHMPLIDRDGIESIQKYLDWRISKYGFFDIGGPLYLNKHGKPVTSLWISTKFFELADNAGIQKKISKNQYKIRAHEVRDLLKSTLIDSGCKEYVADHVIGHMPKDSYEKQTKLYPETLRKEYAKASKRLNIFTKFTSVVNGTDDSDELRLELKEKLSELDKIKESRIDDEARQYRNEKFAAEQVRQMRLLQDTVNELKKEIRTVKQDEKKPIEFCCISCSTVHNSQECPACGSKMKRIYEENI